MTKRKKDMQFDTEEHIAERAEKIARTHIVIQDLDKYIEKNNLPPSESLTLRLLRKNYVNDIRFDLRVKPLAEHSKECGENPSLLWLFRNKTLKTLTTLFLVMGGFYFFFRIIEIMTGLEGILKLLTP